jgi:hypothetical protein
MRKKKHTRFNIYNLYSYKHKVSPSRYIAYQLQIKGVIIKKLRELTYQIIYGWWNSGPFSFHWCKY